MDAYFFSKSLFFAVIQETETMLNFSFFTAHSKPDISLQKKRQKVFLGANCSKEEIYLHLFKYVHIQMINTCTYIHMCIYCTYCIYIQCVCIVYIVYIQCLYKVSVNLPISFFHFLCCSFADY